MTKIIHDKYTIEVGEATMAMGLVRNELASSYDVDNELLTEQQVILRVTSYPDCVSCVVKQTGFDRWPITFDQWLQLPERFVAKWEAACYANNPHWVLVSSDQYKMNADFLLVELGELIDKEIMEKDLPSEYPEMIPLNNPSQSLKIWKIWRAFEGKLKPSEVISEPDWLLEDIMTINSSYAVLRDSKTNG